MSIANSLKILEEQTSGFTGIYADRRFVLKNKNMWYNINREGLRELVSLRTPSGCKIFVRLRLILYYLNTFSSSTIVL